DAREEIVAGRVGLGHALVSAEAVVADRAGRDEDAGARVGCLQPRDEVARAVLARGADALANRGVPALGDRLARVVDDAVASGERRGRGRAGSRIPGRRLDA